MKNNANKGFTLVELSIVLVIIGLLIGGILVAQSMIGTAKIQSITRQLSQFDAAVANFQTKFNQLPGDTALMGDTVGDNNGTITDVAGAATIAGYAGEIGKFWSDLSASGLTKPSGGSYTDVSTAGAVPAVGTHAPRADAGTNAMFYAYGVSGVNYYHLAKASTSATAIDAPVAFKAAEALALDTKIDDGINNTGNVRGGTTAGGDLTLVPGAADSTACAGGSASTYAVAATVDRCAIRVRMGTSTGLYN